LAFAALAAPSYAAGAVDAEEDRRPNPVWSVALVEGFILLDSGVTTAAPEAVGLCGLLLTPLAAQGRSTVEDITAMSLWASLCLYKIIAPSSLDLSDREVFAHTFTGWHVVGAGLVIAGAAAEDARPEDETVTLRVSLTPRGWRAGFAGTF